MSIRRNAALNYHQTMELMSNISGFTNKITDEMKNIIEKIPPETNLANVTQHLLPYHYTKHLQDWLAAHGNMLITSMVIRRAPITSATNDISQYVSLGAWEKAKQLAGYDSMFHLVLIINDSFIIQKLSVVDIRPLNEREKAEYMTVPTPYISINNFLDRGRHYMGDKAFFTYNPFENNCQNFVLNLLKGNNLATPEIEGFVIQPLQELIRHLPSWYPTVAHLATNLANLSGSGKLINHRRSTGIFTSEFRDLVNDIKMNHERLRNAITHLKALEGLSYRDNSQRFEELYEIHHDAEQELILNTQIAILELSSYLNATGQNDTMNNKTARAAKPVVDALKYLISIDAWPENRVADDYASSIGQSESSTLPIGGDTSDTTVPTEFFTGSGAYLSILKKYR